MHDELKTELKHINDNLSKLNTAVAINDIKTDLVITKVNDHLHEHRTLRIAMYIAMMSAITGLGIAVVRIWFS